MMKTFNCRRNFFLLFLFLITAISTVANGQHFQTSGPGEWVNSTRLYVSQLKSLTAIVNDNWQTLPLLHLHATNERMTVGFDEMSHEVHDYICRLERCEPDWTTSQFVFENDWMQGFSEFPILDYQHSINTTIDYTHYTITIPNEQCQITMSGNYRLRIFDRNHRLDQPVAEVCFMVVEPKAKVALTMTTITDKDVNGKHQQISATLEYPSLNISDRERQLYTVMMQNWHSPRINVPPTYQMKSGMKWDHDENYIFLAGNEYHKFEILATSHPTMGIERIEWNGHQYDAYLHPDVPRPFYLTDEAAKGFSLVRNSDRQEDDVTCDYVSINYQLQAPYHGNRYIFGQWTNSSDSRDYLMYYDNTTSSYHATIMQKQGYYSYIYVDDKGLPAETEGNFFQTSNSYQMLAYYRPIGGRTWLLVGFCELLSR